MFIPKPEKKPKNPNSRRGAVQRGMNVYREKHPICEWCRRKRSVSTHHIKKTQMGGCRKDSPLHQEWNYAALCLEDHEKADAGLITQYELYWELKGMREEDVAEKLSDYRTSRGNNENCNRP